jgi:M6 family metalloprotease-like protein
MAFELANGLFGPRSPLLPLVRPASREFKGVVRLPVILALFSDSPEPSFTEGEIDQAVFTGPSDTGTFSEFYDEVSRGQFSVVGDVFPWVRAGLSLVEVAGAEFGLGDDARMNEYLIDAIDLLDPDIDWGLYDNDGPDGLPNSGDDDGMVDVVTVEYLEVAASCGGTGTAAIWPHRFVVRTPEGHPHETQDVSANGGPILVSSYITQSVADCSGESIQTASTIAHEFGHALGLPDYYHPVGGLEPADRRWVLGCWSLMAAGGWGCGPVGSNRTSFGPTHMVAFSKAQLGWLEFTEVPMGERNATYELGPVQTTGEALRIPLDLAGTQSLLLEYRAQSGFDWQLPAAGVLAFRHDLGGKRRPAPGERYFLSLLEADGDGALLRTSHEGGDRGVAGDAFGRGSSAGRINNLTTPSTRTGSGLPTSVTIHEIRIEGGRAHIRLSTALEPAALQPDGPPSRPGVSPAETRIPVFGGAMPYTVSSESLPPGLTLSADQDEIVVEGGIAAVGLVSLEILLRDVRGHGGIQTVQLQVDPFDPSEALLLAPWVGGLGREVTSLELDALDTGGNANGRYDVGDLRSWLFGG